MVRGGGERINPYFLLENGFLTDCLLFGNTEVSFTTNLLYASAFTVWKCCKSCHNFNCILSVLNNYFVWSKKNTF